MLLTLYIPKLFLNSKENPNLEFTGKENPSPVVNPKSILLCKEVCSKLWGVALNKVDLKTCLIR